MTIKNSGQSLTEFLIIGPILTLVILASLGLIYYFIYQVSSQYHSYQAILCAVSEDNQICERKLKQKLISFKGFRQDKLNIKKEETAKSIKVKIAWQDKIILLDKNIRRANSVYLPKKI